MGDREQERLFKALCKDEWGAKVIRSLRKRGIDPKSLIDPLRWVVFWDRQPDRGMEWLASGMGHDRRSLKRISRRLDNFLEEKKYLESAAGRPLNSFRRQKEKLNKETSRINPSAILSPDLLTEPIPATLEERGRLVKKSVPIALAYLRQIRDAWASDARDAFLKLIDVGFSYQEMAYLLNATADALGFDKEYTADALRKRFRRLRPSS